MCYTSYAGNFGTWHMAWTPQYNDRLTGLFNADGAVRTTSVTDGFSNTLAFGEHTRDDLPADEQIYEHWWTSGYLDDTLFTTFYPMNPQRTTLNDENDAQEVRFILTPHRASTREAATSRSLMARSGFSKTRSTRGRSTRQPS